METRNIEDIYELSPIQQGILFHSLYVSEPDMYFIQLLLTLRGAINVTAFRQAWQQVLGRHSVLRTSFHWEGVDKPLQVVQRQLELTIEQQDWRTFPELERQQLIENYIKTDRKRGFDITQAPLMRLALFHITEGEYQFVWSHHHLILDGWSMSLLLKEVFTFYESIVSGQPLIAESAHRYCEYITWLQQQDLTEAEKFWRQALQDFRTPTTLPVESVSTRLPSQQEGYARQQISFSPVLTAALRSFVRHNQLTLNTLVQGAWGLLLSRYSGEQDIVFGTVVSDREATLPGSESIVGPLINTLPARVQVNQQTMILTWLKNFQIKQAQMRKYCSIPLSQVQACSEVPRGFPLFETAFAFENYPIDASLKQPYDHLEIIGTKHISRTNYALAVVALADPVLTIRITYDSHRFDAATIERMLGHMESLLSGMVVNSNRSLF
ncbi:MAG: condensation domain-containing protein, partial [Acidobacteriota bacterium]